MTCEYAQRDDGLYVCRYCGNVRKRVVVRNCPAGVPTRAADAVAALVAICHACERWTGAYCRLAAGECHASRRASWRRRVERGECYEGRW
jgi:hypothetical protein